MKCRLLLALFVGLVLSPVAARAQTPIDQQIQAAASLFRGGDPDGAFAALADLAERHPDNAQVFSTLGNLRRQNEDWAASLVAYQEAMALNPSAGRIMYNLGVAFALVMDKDQAFDWLEKAKASGFNTMAILVSQVAERLTSDARYEGLLPSAEEFADPFVEKTRIIHDWSGENPRDQFGWIARNVGDVDGDGINDVVSSAPTNADHAPAGGKIYVYSGKTGNLIWTASGAEAQGQLGFGVEGAGDVNGDGVPDVVAGAPFANTVLVYSGLDGVVLHRFSSDESSGAFGASVKGVGDANGDGFDDILVGQPFQIFGSPINGGDLSEPGRAHLYSGKDGSILVTHQGPSAGSGFGSTLSGKAVDGGALFVIGAPGAGEGGRGLAFVYRDIEPEPRFTLHGAETGVAFGGMFMSIMGDADADGSQDIFVADFSDNAKGPSTGRIYVFSGVDGSTLHEIGGASAGEGFGIGVSDAGDINGDGHDDLVVGAWQHNSVAASGGKLYVYSGKDGSLLHTVTGKVMGETLGFDTTSLGDVDGDGTIDFLITSAWSGIAGFQSGRTYVLSVK